MVYEKLGKVADILRTIVHCICIICVIVFGIKQYEGIITLDQFLLYTVCAMMVVQILHEGRKDLNKDDEVEEMKNNE